MMDVPVSQSYGLMKYLLLVGVVAIGLATIACGIGDDKTTTGTTRPTISRIYVDANSGNDTTGDGSPEMPFRTITKGLDDAHEHYTVIVAPGTYDETVGELFPIQLKENVAVEGDIPNKGNGSRPTIIAGMGNYSSPSLGDIQSVAVVCANGAVLAGFTVSAANGIAIWCEGDITAMRISENTISNNYYGVVLSGTAQPVIRNNLISDNDISGVETLLNSGPKIRGNTITNNSFGIVIRNASQPDLGTTTDPGGNNLANNVNCDLHNLTENQISAIGNVWDDDQFLFSASSSCSDGVNISNAIDGVVIYQYVPLSDSPIFPGSSEIEITMPEKGAIISTDEPRFAWIGSGNSLVFLGVFNKPISVKSNTIVNNADLVWLWHSGLDRGREGDVSFYEGVNILNGELDNSTQPVPLERGRSFYWAIWAWDEEGLKITHSSEESYFTIGN